MSPAEQAVTKAIEQGLSVGGGIMSMSTEWLLAHFDDELENAAAWLVSHCEEKNYTLFVSNFYGNATIVAHLHTQLTKNIPLPDTTEVPVV